MAFVVQVVRGERPVRGARVKLGFKAWHRGMSDAKYTDEDGEVEFDEEYDEGDVTVYVNGRDQGDYFFEDPGSVTINIGDDDEEGSDSDSESYD